MRNTLRLTAAATIAAAAIAGLPHPAPATAALSLISAGDRIDYINPTGPGQFCTIGYSYTGLDLHTYAVTAGHCRNSDTGYARDTQTQLTGHFVRSVVDSPRSGGADYGLIDFGKNSLSSTFIGDIPITGDHPQPRIGQQICRLGVSSGLHCGQVSATQGADQYLTVGLPVSIPGDSGGPVWTPAAHGYAQIVGIWLGEKTTTTRQQYGRFASLASGLDMLANTQS